MEYTVVWEENQIVLPTHCENLDSSLQQCRQRQSVRELFYAEPQLGPVLPLPPLHWQTWLTSQRGELLPGTMYSLRFTAYIVPCTVNSVQYTVYSARFLSLFCLYQLVPPLHVRLSSPDHCQSSAPAGGEHTTH